MKDMFKGCSSLTSFPDISKWSIENVSNKRNMFLDCDESIIPEKFKKEEKSDEEKDDDDDDD